MDVLAKIKELMKERNWSQYKLAQEAMLTTGTINNMFARKTLPSLQSLQQICDAFGISIATFFDEEKNQLILNKEETKLITDYRLLGKKEKIAVKTMIKELK